VFYTENHRNILGMPKKEAHTCHIDDTDIIEGPADFLIKMIGGGVNL